MAEVPGYLLSEQAIRKLVDDHRRLASEVYQLKQRFESQTYGPPDWGRENLWGITAHKDAESYPAESNVYRVNLLSRTFDQTAVGSDTATDNAADPSTLVTARTLNGANLPEGTPVQVTRLWGKAGVQYWIMPPWAFIRKAKAKEDIAWNDSGNADLYVNGSASETNVTTWFNWMQGGLSQIANESEGLVCWFADEGSVGKWVWIAAECPA